MRNYIEERTLEIAEYIISNKSTVRDTAKVCGCSKSTVHKDCVERLPRINSAIAKQVKEILDVNKAERHIRGGMATKMKYTNKAGA